MPEDIPEESKPQSKAPMPVEQKPPTPHHIPETIAALWNWAWGFFELQSVGDDVRDHAPLIRKRVSVLVFMFLVGLLGYSFKGCRDEGDISNALNQSQENASLAQTYKAQLDQVNNQIIQIKVDANESVRGKDEEIAQISTDKNAALQRVAELESLPQTAFLVYSNANGLMRSGSLNCGLQINGFPIAHYATGQSYIVLLDTNRTLSITIPNLDNDENTIKDLTIDFNCWFNQTNIASGIADGWWKVKTGTFMLAGRPSLALEIVSDYDINSLEGFSATPLVFSTNLPPQIFPASINICAPGMPGVESYFVNIILP